MSGEFCGKKVDASFCEESSYADSRDMFEQVKYAEKKGKNVQSCPTRIFMVRLVKKEENKKKILDFLVDSKSLVFLNVR